MNNKSTGNELEIDICDNEWISIKEKSPIQNRAIEAICLDQTQEAFYGKYWIIKTVFLNADDNFVDEHNVVHNVIYWRYIKNLPIDVPPMFTGWWSLV